MRIAHLINNLSSGGAEKLLSDILPRFKNEGHEVHLIISSGLKNFKRYESILEDAGVKIIDANKNIYNPLLIFSFARILRKGQYDVVHAHLFPSQYYLAAASLFVNSKTKYYKTEHSIFNERRNFKVLQFLEKWKYGRYDQIIAITDLVKLNLQKWIGENHRITTILNGINLEQVNSEQKNIDENQYKFLESKNYNILMTGRFNGSEKDQKTLLQAVQLLKDSSIQLYFAGEGALMKDVKKESSTLKIEDQIHFLGLRNDVYKLMSLVDLNVLSTNFEGLSGVALESMASGIPFIGSDVEGVNNVVADMRQLFPAKNPKALALKIKELMENKKLSNKLVELSLEHVKQYDISLMVQKHLYLYNEEMK